MATRALRRARKPIFGAPEALPRGPHSLSRGQVAASQRARLMAALAEEVAAAGYAAATIAGISRRAGVSPRTFYEHFDGKEDCLFAAYDAFVEILLARMGAEVTPDSDWHEFITSALNGYLGALEDDPVAARAFLIEMDAAGPGARRRRRRAYEQFAELIKVRHAVIRRRDSSLAPLPDRVYLALAHGVRELVCDALEASSRPRLTELGTDLLFWITATIRGAAGAYEELDEDASGHRRARSS
jgi:AcrR family transcriptional regulator